MNDDDYNLIVSLKASVEHAKTEIASLRAKLTEAQEDNKKLAEAMDDGARRWAAESAEYTLCRKRLLVVSDECLAAEARVAKLEAKLRQIAILNETLGVDEEMTKLAREALAAGTTGGEG